MTAPSPEGLNMTDEQILAHFEIPGLNLEATLDAHDLGLLLGGIRTLLSASKPAAPAQSGVIAAAEALIDADRAFAMTDDHVNALENAIAIQRGTVKVPAPAQSAEPVARETLEELYYIARENSKRQFMDVAVATLKAAPQPSQTAVVLDDERAWEKYLNEQKRIVGMPGLMARPCFIAGYRAALPQPVAQPVKQTRALTEAARDVLAERQRQVNAEGWTPEHDDEHDSGEMADAAAAYALHASGWTEAMPREVWPADWSQKWWKPTTPRRNLVKAGALILAEIERIDRAAARPASGETE